MLSSYHIIISDISFFFFFFFFSSRRRHTRLQGDWSSDVCSSDLRAVDAESAFLGLAGRLSDRHPDAVLPIWPEERSSSGRARVQERDRAFRLLDALYRDRQLRHELQR